MNGRREISGREKGAGEMGESSHFLTLSSGRTLERRLRMKDVVSVTKELLFGLRKGSLDVWVQPSRHAMLIRC